MITGESIGFSSRLCTFFMEQDRLFSSYLAMEGELTYSELTLMNALHEVDAPFPVNPLVDFLILSPRTVRSMLLVLEDKGFIKKSESPDDNRFMLIELSQSGKRTVEKSTSDLFFLLMDAYWDDLPDSDFNDILRVDIRHDVNVIRGFSVVPFGDSSSSSLSIPADFFIFWRVAYDRWSRCVRKASALSLNDFRVLYYLFECGSMHSSDVAEVLCMQRSALSLSKRRLVDQGLVAEKRDNADGRKLDIECSARGKRLAARLFGKLDHITREIHSGMSEEDAYLVNAWYARMFSNMRKGKRAEEKRP